MLDFPNKEVPTKMHGAELVQDNAMSSNRFINDLDRQKVIQ